MKVDDHEERAAKKKSELKRRNYNNNNKRKKEECVKVVYISSPMKVKTSASEFRSLVQQLTGKHSDISQYSTIPAAACNSSSSRGGSDDFHHMVDFFFDESSLLLANYKETKDQKLSSSSSISPPNDDTPTSSVDLGPSSISMSTDNVFGDIFSSDHSFYDPSQMDVLGSFDDLL